MNRIFLKQTVLTLILGLTVAAGPAAAADHSGHSHSHGAPSPALTSPEAAPSAAVYTATGVIRNLDAAAQKILLEHGPVPALEWPAMTMNFAVADPALLEGLKPGDKVSFDFQNQGQTSIIIDLAPTN
jgi:Cu(I)/Ag(I) efflux system protein CusF